MIEQFIFRRAFLDCYYNFRAKGKDWIGGNLPAETWNTAALSENSHQLEHKVGFDFTYQYDYSARLKLGMNYVFNGINVPETVEGALTLGYEF